MNTSDGLRHALEELHDPPAPEALWPRLRARRRRQLRSRRAITALASTGLAAALFVVLVRPGTVPAPAIVTRAPSMHASSADDMDARVRAIDRALQAAYDRGASDTEIAPMWEARHALLAGNDTPRGHATDINDI